MIEKLNTHLKLKSGNIELSADDNSEIEAIFKEDVIRFRGRQKSEEKKKKRQMTKKAKHMLKMVNHIIFGCRMLEIVYVVDRT